MGNMSGSYGSHYTLWQSITQNWQNIEENYSNVTVKMYLSFDGSSYWAYTNYTTYGNMGSLGNYSIQPTSFTKNQKKDLLMAEWTGNVYHNADGSKYFEVRGYWDTDTTRMGSGSCGAGVWLTQINRLAYFASQPYLSNRPDEYTLDISYRPDRWITAAQYNKNGEGWNDLNIISGNWNSPDSNSVFRISGLSANTTYSIKMRIQYNNNLWNESDTIWVTTNNFPYITNVGTANLPIGDSQILTLFNPYGRTVTVRMNQNTNRGTLLYSGTTSGTSITFVPNEDTLYNTIKGSTSGKAVYSIDYNGTRSTSDNYTYLAVESECVPEFSDFDYAENNNDILDLTGDSHSIIVGYSDLKVIISPENRAKGKNGAEIKYYKADLGGASKTVSVSSFEEDENIEISFTKITNNLINVSAIDSRGYSTTLVKTVEKIAYEEVSIESLKASRLNDIGQDVFITFTAKLWNNNFGAIKNSVKKIAYEYKNTNSNVYITGTTELTYSLTKNRISGTVQIAGDLGADGFDVNETYNIRLLLADELSSDLYSVTLGSGTPAIAIYKNKAAIGQKYLKYLGGDLQVAKELIVNTKKIWLEFSTDSKGWIIWDFGFWKIYTYKANISRTWSGNAWINQQICDIPEDITSSELIDTDDNIILTNSHCNDSAILSSVGLNSDSTSFTLSSQNKYSGDVTNSINITIAIIKAATNKSAIIVSGDYNISYGDLTEDGEITIDDTVIMKQAIDEEIELSKDQKKAADLSGEGKISSLDYEYMMNFINNPNLILSQRQWNANQYYTEAMETKYVDGHDCIQYPATFPYTIGEKEYGAINEYDIDRRPSFRGIYMYYYGHETYSGVIPVETSSLYLLTMYIYVKINDTIMPNLTFDYSDHPEYFFNGRKAEEGYNLGYGINLTEDEIKATSNYTVRSAILGFTTNKWSKISVIIETGNDTGLDNYPTFGIRPTVNLQCKVITDIEGAVVNNFNTFYIRGMQLKKIDSDIQIESENIITEDDYELMTESNLNIMTEGD